MANALRTWMARLTAVMAACAPGSVALAQDSQDARSSEQQSPSDGESEEPKTTGESWLYQEFNLSLLYSDEGVAVPWGTSDAKHVVPSPRMPRNLVGVEYVRNFTDAASINQTLGGGIRLAAVDLHARLEWDPTEGYGDYDRVKLLAQDFWARFEFAGAEGLSLRVGQVTIPYGVNPILAPRGDFLMPLEAMDTGSKWEWGTVLRGPLDIYEWEVAATIGTGIQIHSPELFSSDRSYMLSAALRGPTMHEFQYGISGMFGEVPDLMLDRVVSEEPISRWRLGLDAFYKYRANTMFMAQLIYGQDGFRDDSQFTFGGDQSANDVLGYMVMVDWVPPFGDTIEAKRGWQNWALAGQFMSIYNDLRENASNDTFATLELRHSLTDGLTLRLDWQHDLHMASMGGVEDDKIWLSLYYYAL